VQRALTAGGPYTTLASGLTTTSYQDSPVTNGTRYYYVVTASGNTGTSQASVEASTTPVTAPVTVNLDYHPSAGIYMNGSSSYSATDRGSASRVAPLDYDGINAASVAVNWWNTGTDGTAALSNLKTSEGVATTIGVSAMLISHGSSSSSSGLGGAKLLKSGLSFSQSPDLINYKTLFKLSGLNTSHIYQLALPSQSGTTNTSSSYRVGPVRQTMANGAAATDWNPGINYAVLGALIPNAAGEIHVQAMLNTTSAPLNGWQLVDQGTRTAGANAYTTIDSCSFGNLGAATITDSTIALTVPYGTAISALTPGFVAATGATISPNTAQNFANPVTYRITAENRTAYQDYTVTLIVAPDVGFATTVPAITAAATGAELLSTGTLIAANHLGSTALAPLTLTNGLAFGISTVDLSSGWGSTNQRTDTDAHGKVPLADSSTPFGTLMRSYGWSSSTYYYLDIPGLTPGHNYRLQLVSPNPANCKVSLEAAPAITWSGTTPSLLTATWTVGDTVANLVLTRTAGEIDFTCYALHDVTPGFQPAPTGLAATAGDGQIGLTWNAAPGATRYTVKRAGTTGGPYTAISTATGTNYLDLSLTNGQRYYYVISATTALGDTPNSAQASALPARFNHPPVAGNQSLTTAEDTALAITLAATDADGDPLTYQIGSAPAHGTLSGTAPNLSYLPAANYNGSDSFTFTVNDGIVSSSNATVSLTVTPVNDPPVAVAQSVNVAQNTAKAITLSASDVDGDTLGYAVVSGPAHGTLSGSAPNLNYTPGAGYTGSDSFTFTANDGLLTSAPATVSLTVTATNIAPVAAAQSVTVNNNMAKAITLTASDANGDTLTFAIASAPAHGSLTGLAPNVTYTPAAGYCGSDSFTFRANDGISDSPAATVTLAVLGQVINVNCGRSSSAGTFLDGTASGSAVAPFGYTGTSWNETMASSLLSNNGAVAYAGMRGTLLNSAGVATTAGFLINGGTATPAPTDWAPTGKLTVFTACWQGDRLYAASGSGLTLTVVGLDSQKCYDLYVVSGMHGAAPGGNRNGSFTTPNPTTSTQPVTNICSQVTSFVEGVNYVRLANVKPDDGVISVKNAPSTEKIISGFQIVEINVIANQSKNLLGFSAAGQSALITGTTVSLTVPYATDLATLAPTFTWSANATCNRISGATWDFSSVNPQTCTVTAEDGSTKVYSVTVTKYPATFAKVLNVALGNRATFYNPASPVASVKMGGTPYLNPFQATLETRAAPLAYNGTTWNDANSGNTLTKTNLLDSTGGSTAVGYTLTQYKSQANDHGGIDVMMLLSGGVQSGGTASTGNTNPDSGTLPTLTLSGLQDYRSYDLCVISCLNYSGQSNTFNVGGTLDTTTATNPTISGGQNINITHAGSLVSIYHTSWQVNKNYGIFSGLTSSSGSIVMRDKSLASNFSLNGFQLVEHPATGKDLLAFTIPGGTTTDPANPASWQGVTGYTNIVGADQSITITLPFTPPRKFYRLNVRVE